MWNNVAACQVFSLLILSVLLSIAYSVWLIVIIVFHIKTYCDWRIVNEEVLMVDQESTCNSWKTVNKVRRQGWEGEASNLRGQFRQMRLLCFDLRSFLHGLCRKNFGLSSAHNANSDNFVARERRTSIISSNALNMNYDDFVRHLQPEVGAISAIGSCQHTMSSTPVPNEEGFVFEYPSVNSHLSRSNIVA
ncbi:hypothetical protein ACH3XW_21940 [Acanthocheilonema viteae]